MPHDQLLCCWGLPGHCQLAPPAALRAHARRRLPRAASHPLTRLPAYPTRRGSDCGAERSRGGGSRASCWGARAILARSGAGEPQPDRPRPPDASARARVPMCDMRDVRTVPMALCGQGGPLLVGPVVGGVELVGGPHGPALDAGDHL